MPFYLRSRPGRPLWQPALWGGITLLVITTGQSLFGTGRLAHPPSLVARLLFVLGFTLLGALLSTGFYWGLNHPKLPPIKAIRWAGMSLLVWLALTIVTLALKHFEPGSSWSQVTRASFLLSTGGLAILFGGLYAFGLLFRTEGPVRVYLSPAEFAALSPDEQARHQPVADQPGS